jgi:hypothetical protein
VQLVGRETELAAVTTAVADANSGASVALGLFGEAGIGKSALLAAVRDASRDEGMLVLGARAAEHERDVPFGVVVDALDDHVATMHPRRVASLGADLGAVLPAAAARSSSQPPAGAGAAERFRYHRALAACSSSSGASSRSCCCWMICTGRTTPRSSWSCISCDGLREGRTSWRSRFGRSIRRHGCSTPPVTHPD